MIFGRRRNEDALNRGILHTLWSARSRSGFLADLRSGAGAQGASCGHFPHLLRMRKLLVDSEAVFEGAFTPDLRRIW